MSAKELLLSTLVVLEDCLSDQALIDKAPADVDHNKRAAMLRQGLAVLVFSTVESFIRERTSEVLNGFTNKRVKFSDLSPALQNAVTIGAMDGIKFRLKLQPSNTRVAWLLSAVAPIANAAQNIKKLSTYSFGSAASNLVEGDVKDILKAFGVIDPWRQLTKMTSRLGVSIIDCESDFEAIKKRRHSSAHAFTSIVPYADLFSSMRSALAICIAFDILLSHAQKMFNKKLGPGEAGRAQMTHADVSLIFIVPRQGALPYALIKEQLPPPALPLSRPIIKAFASRNDAIDRGKKYAQNKSAQIVIVNAMSIPVNWFTW